MARQFYPLILAVCLIAGGCGRGDGLVVTRLYFGLSSPSGPICDSAFQAFVDSAVTPRFPDGLTVYAASGQWRSGSSPVEREASRVVEIVHPHSATADSSLAWIARSYKQTFQQQSVLTVRQRPEWVQF